MIYNLSGVQPPKDDTAARSGSRILMNCRLFFRTVQTVMTFWDWQRGKIREANNVVTFFCPIHLEIEMECRI